MPIGAVPTATARDAWRTRQATLLSPPPEVLDVEDSLDAPPSPEEALESLVPVAAAEAEPDDAFVLDEAARLSVL